MRGLALSGGGFRATLFHLGLISYLYDVEHAWHVWEAGNGPDEARPRPLSEIKHIASVSGGSILAAHLVLNWEKYTDFANPEKFAEAADEIVAFAQKDIRGRIVRRLGYNIIPYALGVMWRRSSRPDWKMPKLLKRSTTDSLASNYDRLFKGARLRNLDCRNDKRPHLSLLAVNMGSDGNNSVAFTFEGLSSYCVGRDQDIEQIQHDDDTVSVARAVAASSAFPGLFTPLFYTPPGSTNALRLSDGGIYDNLGIRKFLNDIQINSYEFKEIVVSDASVSTGTKFGLQFLEPITIPIKAADILFRRVYEFEVAAANPTTFKIVGLRKEISDGNFPVASLRPQYRTPLSRVRTDLDKFNDLEVFALVRQGYSAARNALNLAVPPDNSTTGLEPWNPTPGLPLTVVSELTELPNDRPDDAIIRKIDKQLGNSCERTISLFRLSDPITWVNLAILFTLIGGIILIQRDNFKNYLQLQSTKANALSNIDFNKKSFVVPVKTDASLPEALNTLQNVKNDKFGDSYVFLVANENREQVFKTVAVYKSNDEAKRASERATRQYGAPVNGYLPYDQFCGRTPLWYRERGYYICTALGAEGYGFDMILNLNVDEAIKGFDLANEIFPSINSVSEISELLNANQDKLKVADSKDRNETWIKVINVILDKYTWKVENTVPKLKQKVAELSSDTN